MHSIAAEITILTKEDVSVKLSLSLKLWLSQYDWQSFGERENFSKSLVGILFLLSNVEKIISISLSLLESGEPFSKFLFLFSELGKRISDFSFSSRNWRFKKRFSFSSRNLRKENPFLFLFSKVENLFSNFFYSSRNWGNEFKVSLSLLEIGEKNIKFLFLFSIGLFGLSSMTVF